MATALLNTDIVEQRMSIFGHILYEFTSNKNNYIGETNILNI